MKRSCLTLLAAALAHAIGFALYLWLRAPGTITVVITNRTAATIPAVRVLHDQRVYAISGLSPGESRTVLLRAKGETTYATEARLASGRAVRNQDVYAEPGYQLREVVTEVGVSTEVISLRGYP